MIKQLIGGALLASALCATAQAGDLYLDIATEGHLPNRTLYLEGYWNPIGVVRLRYVPASNPQLTIYIEHKSSVPNERDDSGINSIGVMWSFKLD
jgi:hypothetical protein